MNGFKNYGHLVISRLEEIDRTIAFRVTLKNIFQPLYQDRSFIGYLLGFIFRGLRLIFGGIFYAVIISFAIAIFIVWAAIPVFIIYKIIQPALTASFLK
ncbi:MAG: hypothetical protein NTW60_01020 [Candidatus Wolfebacteria bacterium]|nr:hypothetical protein [Candidatus Wolfebacteria bacterium]